MYKDKNIRSIVKGISWRIFASATTITIVYLFFKRLDLAIAAGAIETGLKIIIYWFHERMWLKIKWGRKKITPFNLWFTGLPLSGKTTIANQVYEKLEKLDIPIERLDSKDIRQLIPKIGFTRNDRNMHMYRIGHLIKTLQKNSISIVASFVSPYRESRKVICNMAINNVIIYIKANIETCKARDKNGKYAKALSGEIKNFTGVSDVYEEPKSADLIIDTDILSVDQASEIIVKFVKDNYVK